MRRAWSLRLRLLVGQVVVLVIVCIGIGAVTELALYRYLIGQLDMEVSDASHRSVRIFGEPWSHHPHLVPRPGPGPNFLDAPGQPVGTVAAVIDDNGTIDAGYLTDAAGRAALTDAAKDQLRSIPVNRKPVTRDLDGLGRYRIESELAKRGGDTVIIRQSMANVD